MMARLCMIWIRFLGLPLLFVLYTALIATFITRFSKYPLDGGSEINITVFKFPSCKEDVLEMANQFKLYQKTYPWHIKVLFCLVYLYKQAFAIPGSFFLNLLAGAIFGTVKGIAITSIMTGMGATACYVLSFCFCKPVLELLLPRQITSLAEMLERNKDCLFFYLLGSRILPVSPNWLMNVLSPIVGIPWYLFLVTVVLGLLPYNFITVQAGTLLSKVDPEKSISENSLLLSGVALIAIIPGILLPKIHKYLAAEPKQKSS